MSYPHNTLAAASSLPVSTAFGRPGRVPVRPGRPGAATRGGIVQWNPRQPVVIGPGAALDSMRGRPNPWVASLAAAEIAATSQARDGNRPINLGSGDESEWTRLEAGTPEVRTAISRRVADLLGGGVRLRKGRGPGSEELFDFANFMVPSGQITQMMASTLMIIYRGWAPMNTPMIRRFWAGRNVEVVVPHRILPAQNYQFEWSDGVQPWLIYKTPLNFGRRGAMQRESAYDMSALRNQMFWFTPANHLTIPYGEPLHFYAAIYVWAARQLWDIAQVQAPMSQGLLQVRTSTGLDPSANDESRAEWNNLVAVVREQLKDISATGAIVLPDNVDVKFESITAALPGWTNFHQHVGATISALYAGSNQAILSVGESAGSRATSMTHASGISDLARVDARVACEQWSEKFLRPYLSWNLPQIAPELPRVGPWDQWIPAEAMPELVFNSVSRVTREDLDVIEKLKKLGVEGAEDVRVDVADILAGREIRMLNDGDIGAAIDLSKTEPTVPLPPGVGGPLEADQDGNLRSVEEDDRRQDDPRRAGRPR